MKELHDHPVFIDITRLLIFDSMHIRIPGKPVFEQTFDRHILNPVNRHLHIFRSQIPLHISMQPPPCSLNLRDKILHVPKLIMLNIFNRNFGM